MRWYGFMLLLRLGTVQNVIELGNGVSAFDTDGHGVDLVLGGSFISFFFFFFP